MGNNNQPNIIMIMTDQQRYDTIQAYGNAHMITPNMDKIAERAVSFSSAFCCGATCVASRSAIFTGMYAHNTGVYGFQPWAHHRSWVEDLNEGGYHCVNIGKMHVIPRDEKLGFHERCVVENPTGNYLANGGVDDEWGRYLSSFRKARPLDRHQTDPQWKEKFQGVPWHLDEHLQSDVFIGNSALAWIKRHQPNKPVFLQVGFTGPHEPFDPLPRHLALYNDRKLPKARFKEGELDEKPPQHKAHQKFNESFNHESHIMMSEATEEHIDRMRRHYYANVTTVDEKIGEIIQALEEKGYLENALVIFTSDHGEMLGDHQLAYKWLMYDSVVHIPLMIWDTRTNRKAEIRDLVSLMDLGPTILDAAQISVPAYLEGRSLLGYTQAKNQEKRGYVFCEDNYLTMIRGEQFKLVHYTGQENFGELYNLKDDPDELDNLYFDAVYEQVKLGLEKALMHWQLNSNYQTAMYRNQSGQMKMLHPKEHSYLHYETLSNSDGWLMRDDSREAITRRNIDESTGEIC